MSFFITLPFAWCLTQYSCFGLVLCMTVNNAVIYLDIALNYDMMYINYVYILYVYYKHLC